MPKRKVPEEEKIKIGGRLREIREQIGISQRQVARETGILQKNISNYERNIAIPPLAVLKILSEYYRESMDSIVYGNENREQAGVNDRMLLNYMSYLDKLSYKEREAVKIVIKGMVYGSKKMKEIKQLEREGVEI